MISTKWLELYRYINTHVDSLPAERLFLEHLFLCYFHRN